MQKTTLLLLLFFTISIIGQTTHNINNPEQIESLSLNAGDTVILADGTYTSDERIKFSPTTATAALPITFKAATPGGVVFTGGLRMSIGGDNVIVDGFHWKGGYGASNFIEFRDGSDYANNSTIQNCAIDGLEISPDDKADDGTTSITKHRWIVLYGTNNTVINCSFMNKESAGALILVELYYNASPDGSSNTSCNNVGHTITKNYFYKYAKIDPSLSNSGDSETIRIGSSNNQNVNSNTTVSNNYFVEADGENEIITNKSKNNKFINNTFRRCRGSLVLRHGSNATVDGNYFLGEDVDGTGGIRITDSDHTITNNYIQDCITVASQAKWNNGITFIGGGDNAAVTCTASNTTNGYQKSNNITISNNTIINTNAPLFYNTSKGTNDVTGTLSNNLIFFASGDANVSDVISGDTASAYNNMGTSLTYADNVYTGTSLGVTNSGFSEETGITATANGEIFTLSGTGSTGKGANMGSYMPTTDNMVGYGVGACFLNNIGINITNGNCSVVLAETLTVSSLSTLSSSAASYDVSVTANVSWTAVSNDSWISINTTSGTGSATVSVSVTENTNLSSRTGTVTFKQDPGGDDIVRTLTVTQEGADLIDTFNLINTGTGLSTDKVKVHSFSKEEVGNGKTNYAKNTLDKNNSTVWAADDGSVLSGDYKGDGEYIIYDLGGNENLGLLRFTTTNKSDAFGFQVWVSTSGTTASDFTKILPTSADLLLTATSTTDFNQYVLSTAVNARYIKLIGFGRFNSTGDTRKSVWSAVGEIEFYSPKNLSTNNDILKNKISLYPIPVKDMLNIKSFDSTLKAIKIYSIEGKKIIEKKLTNLDSEFSVDVSSLKNGVYMVNLFDGVSFINKKIIISH